MLGGVHESLDTHTQRLARAATEHHVLRANAVVARDGGDERVILSVRPEDLSLHVHLPQDASNLIEGQVIDTVYLGNFLDCQVQVGQYEVGVQIDHFEQLAKGQKVYLTFRPDHALCLTE